MEGAANKSSARRAGATSSGLGRRLQRCSSDRERSLHRRLRSRCTAPRCLLERLEHIRGLLETVEPIRGCVPLKPSRTHPRLLEASDGFGTVSTEHGLIIALHSTPPHLVGGGACSDSTTSSKYSAI
eukprot:9494724-Pyramimonas_sp.AAC.1